jgi:hypothetical protein
VNANRTHRHQASPKDPLAMAQIFHDARKEGLTFLFFLGLIAFTFLV